MTASLTPANMHETGGKIITAFRSDSRAPRVSLAPKTPVPFPFKRLPRRLGLIRLIASTRPKFDV